MPRELNAIPSQPPEKTRLREVQESEDRGIKSPVLNFHVWIWHRLFDVAPRLQELWQNHPQSETSCEADKCECDFHAAFSSVTLWLEL